MTLKVWDLESGRELRTLTGHSGPVIGIAVSWDWRRAVSTSGDNTLKVWDLETGRELRTLAGHWDTVHRVAVSGDGRRAVSASHDKTLKLWDPETGAVLATFTCDVAALCCVFAGDRRIVAGDASGRVHFLSLELKEDVWISIGHRVTHSVRGCRRAWDSTWEVGLTPSVRDRSGRRSGPGVDGHLHQPLLGNPDWLLEALLTSP